MAALLAFNLFACVACLSTLAPDWHRDFGELLQQHVQLPSQNVDSFLGGVMACKNDEGPPETTAEMNNNWTKCDSTNSLCLDIERQCVSVESLLQIYNHSELDITNAKTVEELSPFLLYQIVSRVCQKATGKRAVTHLETYGYGFMSVTVISLSKLAGAAFIPIMNKKIFKSVLMFFVSLAVGGLAASGLLHLVPQAFEVTAANGDHEYLWRACVVMGGVYLFFVFERFLEMYIHSMRHASGHGHSHGPPANAKSKPLAANDNQDAKVDQAAPKKPEGMATVAWMILISDGLHNFIDGLSIGAAFTDGPMFGISVSLAILFEEIPHGLGDLAIMLTAGVPMKRALFFNYMTTMTCYVGLFVGIGASSNTGFSVWIYAVAGGMFLFIGLVIMVPEMNSALQELAIEQSGSRQPSGGTKLKLFFYQNLGIWIGFAFMVITARYGAEIKID